MEEVVYLDNNATTQPAREVVDPLWVKVLSTWRYGEARELSSRQFVLDLARLGGYMNRRRDALRTPRAKRPGGRA